MQGSLHYTPEHCVVNSSFPFYFGGRSNMFQMVAKWRSFKEPCSDTYPNISFASHVWAVARLSSASRLNLPHASAPHPPASPGALWLALACAGVKDLIFKKKMKPQGKISLKGSEKKERSIQDRNLEASLFVSIWTNLRGVIKTHTLALQNTDNGNCLTSSKTCSTWGV